MSILKDSTSAKIWESTGASLSELNQIVLNLVQEHYILLLKPDSQMISHWKAMGDGDRLLKLYIEQKTGCKIHADSAAALWRLYTGRTVRKRNKKIVERFRFLNPYHKCSHCKTEHGKFHVDHIVSLALGGEDAIHNMQYLCSKCNQKKWRFPDINQLFINILS